jgi:glutamate-1-semialdehyde 2,1-aminomutase
MNEQDPSQLYAGSRAMAQRARFLIPGGSHTYAKGDDQYPEAAPNFIARGKGCHVWDVDGNEFIEYGMGLRAVALGHAYDPVVHAVEKTLRHGTNFSRPAAIEVACAQKFLDLIPNAEQVKFAKDGSTVITAATKLARAWTGRDKIAYCADHPFFSYNDWFIGGMQMSAGIPDEHRALVRTFRYNDLESLRKLFEENPGEIACILLEPERETPPVDGFLHKARDLAHENGALLILDEMITGFRWDNGGAQAVHDIRPDLSGFGKALANGFSVSALAGRRDIMDQGGFAEDRDRVFLLSTTHGAESHALAAAIATMTVYENEDVIGTLRRQGERLRAGCLEAAVSVGVQDHFTVLGHPANLVYATRDADGQPSQEFRTLFMQEIIKRGILGPSFVISYSHSDDDVDRTIEATRGALEVYKRGLENGVETVLEGRPVRPADRRRG